MLPLAKPAAAAVVSPASFQARAVIPSRRSISSRDLGWTSVLLDLHTGVASSDGCAPAPTPDQAIGVALSGHYVSEARVNGSWRRGMYHPGAVCVHTPMESRFCRFPRPEGGQDDFTTAMLYLPHELMASAADHLRRAGQRSVAPRLNTSVDRDPVIAHMASALSRAMQHGEDELYAETAAAWLAVHLLTQYGTLTTQGTSRHAGVVTDARLARVVEFMSAHFHRRITLDELAAEACVSKYHFTRLFRQKMGRSPLGFLADLRLDAAHRMLVTSELAVATIGAACGYPAPSHFTATFTARYGLTPSALRARRLRG